MKILQRVILSLDLFCALSSADLFDFVFGNSDDALKKKQERIRHNKEISAKIAQKK